MRAVTAVLGAALVSAGGALVATPVAAVGRTATVHAPRSGAYLRNGPTAANRLVGRLGHGARLHVACQVFGEGVRGAVRTSGYWNKLVTGAYLPDADVRWQPDRVVPWCTGTGRRTVPVAYARGGLVPVHRGPGTGYARVGWLRSGQPFSVACQQWGQPVHGLTFASPIWNVLATGRHVPDAWTRWIAGRPALPWCGQAPWTAAPGQAAFIRRVAPGARLGRLRHGVPASVTIAQAILETGWGSSRLTRQDHNYFGIKCHGGPGRYGVGCRSYPTTECGARGCFRTRDSFRVYRDLTGSLVDHGHWLAERPRYRPAFRYRRYPDRFAAAIHRAGYATSPTYAGSLIRIMREYRLYRFDR